MIRAVVFDFGIVLSPGEGVLEDAAAMLGVPLADYEAAYWIDRQTYDAGCSDAEYWTPLLERLGKPVTPEVIQGLAALDGAAWAQLPEESRALLRDVRATGREVAVLSNAPFNVDLAIADSDFAHEADYWFISASMGMTKPNAGVYARVTEVLEVEPADIAFLDDRTPNVEGAERAGWTAHLWTAPADARAWLTEVGALSPLVFAEGAEGHTRP